MSLAFRKLHHRCQSLEHLDNSLVWCRFIIKLKLKHQPKVKHKRKLKLVLEVSLFNNKLCLATSHCFLNLLKPNKWLKCHNNLACLLNQCFSNNHHNLMLHKWCKCHLRINICKCNRCNKCNRCSSSNRCNKCKRSNMLSSNNLQHSNNNSKHRLLNKLLVQIHLLKTSN